MQDVSPATASGAEVIGGPRRQGRPREIGLAERRRDQIIQAAIVVFPQKGYERTSMADLARVAGVGQGTVYRYFNGKREILDHLFDYVVSFVFDQVRPDRMGQSVDSLDALVGQFRDVGAALFDIVETNPELVKLAFVEATAVDAELRDRIVGLERMITGYVDRALARAVQDGLIDPDRYSPFLARAIIALLIPGFVTALRGEASAPVRARYVEEVGRFLQHALRDGRPVRFGPEQVAALEGPSMAAELGPPEKSTRAELVRAAFDEMLEHGYHHVGVPDVVARAGVSQGTFYNYFKNKRDVLDAVIDMLFENLGSSLTAVASTSAEDVDAYARELACIYEFASRISKANPHLMNFVALTVPGVDAAATQRLLRGFLAFSRDGERRVAAGTKQKFLRDDCDPAIAGEILVASVVAVMVQHLQPDSTESVQTVVSTMVEFVCRGLTSAD